MKHKDMILRYMAECGSITSLDAMREFGCMRFASRISDLKNDGYDIRKVMEKSTNRFGDTVRYARYMFGEKV